MAHTVDDHAFEAACMRRVMLPHDINPLEAEYHYFPQIFQPPQGKPELGEDEAEYSQVLNCVMMDDADGLHTFRECEYYRITPWNSEVLEDVLEDDSDADEIMEDEANADADPDDQSHSINPSDKEPMYTWQFSRAKSEASIKLLSDPTHHDHAS